MISGGMEEESHKYKSSTLNIHNTFRHCHQKPLRLVDENYQELEELIKAWKCHEPLPLHHPALNKPGPTPAQIWMDKCPEIHEITRAVKIISLGNLPGLDGIHPKVIQRRGPN